MNHEESITSFLFVIICDYNDAYIHVKGLITVPNTATAAATNDRDKKKNCAPLINCIGEINNTQTDHALDINVQSYSKRS